MAKKTSIHRHSRRRRGQTGGNCGCGGNVNGAQTGNVLTSAANYVGGYVWSTVRSKSRKSRKTTAKKTVSNKRRRSM